MTYKERSRRVYNVGHPLTIVLIRQTEKEWQWQLIILYEIEDIPKICSSCSTKSKTRLVRAILIITSKKEPAWDCGITVGAIKLSN